MDWIKVDTSLPDKPEVCQLASLLGLDIDAVTGKLVRVWGWASRSCHGDGVTNVTVMSHLDRVTGTPGFMDAMVKVGWCTLKNDTLTFVNFDRHNSQTAKDRASAAERKARQRCHGNVTNKCDKSVTREEKRREEVAPPVPKGTGPMKRPTLEEVQAHCREKQYTFAPDAFLAYYESNGWKVGRSPMRDWKAACRTWQSRQDTPGRTPQRPPSNAARGSDPHKYDHLIERSPNNG